ncbi:Protein Rf1 [Durusdinium trenchii]|uniref:Mitochondrial (Fertility restorer) (Protein PPR) (Restorer for CMS) n=1 Tax=Durusdinium trenchii TaxID=1381693 RepID=A0ABP0SSY0_9DINO
MGWGGWGKGKGYHHHHHPVERAVAEVAVLGGAALAGAAVASAVAAPRRPAPVVREVVVTPAPVAVAPVMGTPVAATPVVVYKGKGKGKGWKGKGKGVTEVLEVPPLGVSAVGIPASGLSKQQGVTFFSVDVVPEKGASYRLQKRYNDFDGLKDGGQVLEITIPAGVTSGQSLSVTVPDGRQLTFCVPPEAAASASLQLWFDPVAGTVSPMDEDPPDLIDPEEACRYASHCASRKVVLLYYLGPSVAVASMGLCPRGDPSKTYEVRITEDTVIVYLNDACELYLQASGIDVPDGNNGKDPRQEKERREDDARFTQTLAAMPRNSGPGVFTSILAKLARERRWWDVDAVFAEMTARNIKPNRIHLNAAINVFAKARRPQKAEEWLIWMQDNDLKPNEVSYNSVINACAQTGYVERAEMWLGRMLEAGVQANEVSYNSVINACAQKGRVSRAEMWLEKMLAAGVKTDAFSYNSVINACAQRRDIERAETWLEKMLSEGIQADEVSYSSVIKACVQKGELDLAGYWLERMAAAGLQANEVTYNTVAGACLAAGDKERLERWRKLMRLEESTVLKDPPLQKPSRPSSCTTKNLDEVDQDILSEVLPKGLPDARRRRPEGRARVPDGGPKKNSRPRAEAKSDHSQTWMWARLFIMLVVLQLLLAVWSDYAVQSAKS